MLLMVKPANDVTVVCIYRRSFANGMKQPVLFTLGYSSFRNLLLVIKNCISINIRMKSNMQYAHQTFMQSDERTCYVTVHIHLFRPIMDNLHGIW